MNTNLRNRPTSEAERILHRQEEIRLHFVSFMDQFAEKYDAQPDQIVLLAAAWWKSRSR